MNYISVVICDFNDGDNSQSHQFHYWKNCKRFGRSINRTRPESLDGFSTYRMALGWFGCLWNDLDTFFYRTEFSKSVLIFTKRS